MKSIPVLLFGISLLFSACQHESVKTLKIAEGETIHIGMIRDGHLFPAQPGYTVDLYGENKGNQVQPLILTSKGQYVWSEEPFSLEVRPSRVLVKSSFPGQAIVFGKAGNSIAEAYRHVMQSFFPPSGQMPDTLLFTAPQYNTWIELNFNHNQEDILKYARAIIDHGLPPGVFMIDDTWQEDYGIWKFHPGRFPDPVVMVKELHEMGFKVMLWVVPFVSPDQKVLYRHLSKHKALMLEKKPAESSSEKASEPAMVRWWNGVSAVLDFTNKYAMDWFDAELDRMVQEYHVDGFKFDGGDTYFYTHEMRGQLDVTPNEHCKLFAQFGLRFPLNEYRACWKMGSQPLAQRLHDKNHDWTDLEKLIPQMLLLGISGYPFSCPDMIGGGELKSFEDGRSIDQELIVRSAQCHALMPMMQFSVAPWRVLDSTHMAAIKKAVDIRSAFNYLIKELAIEASISGEPIVKSMDFVFPGSGYESIQDQFMLGDSIMVTPLIEAGAKTREVYFPEGAWLSDENEYLTGGKTYEIQVPLDRLPYFKRLN